MKLLILLGLTIVLPIISTQASYAAERIQRIKTQQKAVNIPPPAVLSIIPAQAEPGGVITIFGTGFGEKPSAFLGTTEIGIRILDSKKIEFTIPTQLEAGIYVLYLKREDGATGRPYNFTVLPLRPVLTGLSPDQLNSCAQGKEREITANGQNFSDKSILFFDGAAIKSRLISPEAIAFTVPQVAGGLHQVLVKNSPDISSIPQGLSINTTPEISQVSIGNTYVNYYELNIDGRNFSQNSSIYVDGQRIGGRENIQPSEREKLIYIDCTRLIYQRYPYSPVNKDFRVQVVNQEGQGSQVINVTAP
jgi:IPT/TIG domain